MDIPQEVIIEVALNIVGYLAAGALSILLYRNFARPKVSTEATSNNSRKVVATPSPTVEDQYESKSSGNVEIVTFGTNPAEKLVRTSNRPTINRLRGATNRAGSRDRADIIRIAKEMMKAGATAEKIRGVIPISEAELSLLSMGKNG